MSRVIGRYLRFGDKARGKEQGAGSKESVWGQILLFHRLFKRFEVIQQRILKHTPFALILDLDITIHAFEHFFKYTIDQEFVMDIRKSP